MFNMFTVQVKLWMDVSVRVCDCSFSSIFRKNVFVCFSAGQIRVQYTKWDEITQRRLSKQLCITPKSESKLPCLYVFPLYLE